MQITVLAGCLEFSAAADAGTSLATDCGAPSDSGVDAGLPARDSGVVDAGPGSTDAGTDSGTLAPDAGLADSGVADAGRPMRDAGAVDGGPLPAWLAGKPLNTWFALSGVTVASAQASFPRPQGPGGDSDGKPGLFSWSSGAVAGKRIIHAGGGHTNYAGNEVVGIDLAQDAPQWVTLLAPSADADITYTGAAHYADDRPASRHSYWGEFYNPANNRLMFIGAGAFYGPAGGASWATDGFDLDTNTYDPSSTYPSGASLGWSGQPGVSQAQDAAGNVYTIIPNNVVVRWAAATATWSNVGASNFTSSGYAPMAYDSTRDRLLVMGSSGAKFYSGLGGPLTETTATFSGTQAAKAGANAQLFYVPALDRYLFWRFDPSDPTVYAIDANSLSVDAYEVAGTPPPKSNAGGFDAFFNRFCHVPDLKVVVFYGGSTSDDLAFFRYQ